MVVRHSPTILQSWCGPHGQGWWGLGGRRVVSCEDYVWRDEIFGENWNFWKIMVFPVFHDLTWLCLLTSYNCTPLALTWGCRSRRTVGGLQESPPRACRCPRRLRESTDTLFREIRKSRKIMIFQEFHDFSRFSCFFENNAWGSTGRRGGLTSLWESIRVRPDSINRLIYVPKH